MSEDNTHLAETVFKTDRRKRRPLDRMFETLSHPYRRRILFLLSDHNTPGGGEFAVDDLETEDNEWEHLWTELYHIHLPMLAKVGYIDWDESTHTVRHGPKFDSIAPLLRLLHDHQDELPAG